MERGGGMSGKGRGKEQVARQLKSNSHSIRKKKEIVIPYKTKVLNNLSVFSSFLCERNNKTGKMGRNIEREIVHFISK